MKYKITIPEPCNEDWSKMTPQEKGRFCDKCEKCVIDFTVFSTQQMFNHINSGKDLCGRFRPDQLNRDLVAAPVKKGFSFQWALSSFITFFGVNHVFGQSQESSPFGKIVPVEMSQTTPPEPIQDFAKQEEFITISGTVKDSTTGGTIPFVEVYCNELGVGAISTIDGKYSFIVEKNSLTDSTIMHISCVGYKGIDVCIAQDNQPQNFLLSDSGVPLMEVAVLGGICLEKPTFWQKIGNWFRRVF